MKYFVIFAHVVLWSAYILLLIPVLQSPTVGGIMVMAFFGWLLFPMKHPCDYATYQDWWKDRKNWFKGTRDGVRRTFC